MATPSDDFPAALHRFQDVYHDLFALTMGYPAERAEEPGACGWWSPKQVLAHFSGWVNKASSRYDEFAAGDTRNEYYDDQQDEFNARSVAQRANLNWVQMIDDLRGAIERFTAQAATVPTDTTARDARYGEWLVGLRNDCLEHADQLRQFLHR